MSPPTGRASIDLTVATAPATPKVTRYTTSNIRTMFNYSFTGDFKANVQFDWPKDPEAPVIEPDAKGNFAWVRCTELEQYLLALGIRTSMMVTNADENRAFRFHDGTNFLDLKPALNRWATDDSKDGNHSDPLNPLAARAVCAVAKDSGRFGAKVKHPHQPVILDIEGTATYNGPCDTAEQLLATVTAWRDRFRIYRSELGQDFELYSYFYRGFAYKIRDGIYTPEIAAVDQEAMSLLSGYNIGAYWTDEIEADPSSWFGWVDSELGYIKQHYPQHAENVWATICPSKQLRGGTLAEAVPLDAWKEQLDHLNDKGINAYLWAQGELSPVKPHVLWAAKYAAGVN